MKFFFLAFMCVMATPLLAQETVTSDDDFLKKTELTQEQIEQIKENVPDYQKQQ